MKADLRRLHFFGFVLIAALLTLSLPIILNHRLEEARPQMADWPDVFAAAPQDDRELLEVPAGSYQARVLSAQSRFRLQLIPSPDVVSPSLLVYWVPGGGEGAPGPSGILMGPWPCPDGDALPFPAEASAASGRLVLWSLAHHSPVGDAGLPALETLSAESRR